MIQNIERYINFLCDYEITSEDFLFLYALFLEEGSLLVKYVEAVKGGIVGLTRDRMEYLIERGYLVNYSRDSDPIETRYAPEMFFVTDKFKNIIFLSDDEAGKELHRAYPSFLHINGQSIPAKACDKDEMFKVYARKIGNNIKTHKKVLEALEIYKSKGMINMGFEKFIRSEYWTSINEIEDTSSNTGSIYDL